MRRLMPKRSTYLGWARRGILIMIGCALFLALFVSPQVTWSFGWHQVPYGSPIADGYLDGVIGSEWNDANTFTTKIGPDPVRIYMKHDGKYWYIAMKPLGGIERGTQAWIWFDADHDGRKYEAGDDYLQLPLTGGRLVTNIDYAYIGPRQFKRDPEVGGTDDKVGVGKYAFEMRVDMSSGDRGSLGNDIFLVSGGTIKTVFGLQVGPYCKESPGGDMRIEDPPGCKEKIDHCPWDFIYSMIGTPCAHEGGLLTCEITWRDCKGGKSWRQYCHLECQQGRYKGWCGPMYNL